MNTFENWFQNINVSSEQGMKLADFINVRIIFASNLSSGKENRWEM